MRLGLGFALNALTRKNARPAIGDCGRLLAVVNPEASRTEEALNELAAWFEENCDAAFVTTSQHELKETLLHLAPSADRIVIGGGDGTISNALPELLSSTSRSPCCRSAPQMISPKT